MPQPRPSEPRPAARRGLPLPLSLNLCLAAGLVGIAVAAFRRTGSFVLALGDALVIEALLIFGIAWVGYLRKDGIRIFPPRRAPRSSPAESWKDRVPALGEVPAPIAPIPGEGGPEDEAYARLAAAEEELRKKILGREEGEGPKAENAPQNWAFIGSLALAGAILLALGLCFEYLVPRLLG